jgi:hypothetical protein
MVYIDVTTTNEFILNINNNLRDWYGSSGSPIGASILFTFTHVLSDKTTQTNCIIDPVSGVYEFVGATNGRYTEFYMSSSEAQSYMSYDGEYSVTITNDQQAILYKSIWKVTGNSEIEENPFVEYQSDNENNDSFIYIEE